MHFKMHYIYFNPYTEPSRDISVIEYAKFDQGNASYGNFQIIPWNLCEGLVPFVGGHQVTVKGSHL